MGKAMMRKPAAGEPKADGSKSSGSHSASECSHGGMAAGGGISWSLKSHQSQGGAGGADAQFHHAPSPPDAAQSSSHGAQHPSTPARIITTFRGGSLSASSLGGGGGGGDDFTSCSTEFSLSSSHPEGQIPGGGGGGASTTASFTSSRISKLTFEGAATTAAGSRFNQRQSSSHLQRRSNATSRHSSKRLSELTVNKLQFVRLGRLYGRDMELEELHQAWNAVASSSAAAGVGGTAEAAEACTTPPSLQRPPRRALVTVAGESGTGKSALVEGLRGAVQRDGGFFLVGKFPQQLRLSRQAVEPYAALAQACAELCAWVVSFSAPDRAAPATTPPAAFGAEAPADDAPSPASSPPPLTSAGPPASEAGGGEAEDREDGKVEIRGDDVGGAGGSASSPSDDGVAVATTSSTTTPTPTTPLHYSSHSTRSRRRGSLLPFTLTEFRERLHRDVGSDDSAVLLRVMPCLLPILNHTHMDHQHQNLKSSSHHDGSGGTSNADEAGPAYQHAESIGLLEAHHQFKRAFRRFVRAVASWGPIALVLDDLQWADAASMELLETLLTDREQPALLAIGCYRNDDIYTSMPHLSTVESLSKTSSQDHALLVLQLEIGNLPVERVNELLVDLLSAPSEDETRPLAECVHKKTLGNVFFVVQFLTLLQDAELLTYNLGMLKWTWDLSAIQASTAATDNVVGLMMRKMKGLPPSVGRILPVMACLGSTFGLRIFVHVVKNFQKSDDAGTVGSGDSGSTATGNTAGAIDGNDAALMDTYALQLLSRCESEGLIEPGGGSGSPGGSASDYDAIPDAFYHWVHDKIQEAAFSLIGDDELLTLKLRLGKILYESFDDPDLERHIFTVANLLSADDPPEGTLPRRRPTEVAHIFLKAGVRAIENSAFEQAAGYLTRGIGLLPIDHWQSHYDLSLELFSTAAEAEFCNGNFEMMRTYCNEVTLQENQPLLDKKRVFSVLIDSLLAEQRCSEALAMARYTLARLGCRFPNRCVGMHAIAGIVRIKTALKKNTSPEKLALLPYMDDELAVWTMELLDKFITAAYLCKSDLLPLAIFRGLHLTIQKGVSLTSPGIFSLVGLALAAFVGDYRGGEAFATQALELLKRVRGSRKVESRVQMVVHLFVFHWLRPISLSIKPLLAGYEIGMTMGDTESASRCIYWNLEFSFRTGRSLEALKADCAFYAEQLREVKQLNILTTLLVLWQSVLHLTGENTFRGTITGDVVSQDRILEEAVQDYEYQFGGLYRMLMYVAFVCDEHEIVYLAMKKSEMDKGFFEKIFPGISGIYHLYAFNGLSLISLYRETREKKYLKLARRFSAKIKAWAMAGNPNVTHYDSLLDAELESLRGNSYAAGRLYEVAVLYAGRRGLTPDQALAHERFGEHLLRLGGGNHRQDAEFQVGEALKLYAEWGAHAKVQQLQRKHEDLLGPPSVIDVAF